MSSFQVVIVGGGATGVGILRDFSMRGISALLLEQGDLAMEQARVFMDYYIVAHVMQ